MVETLVMSGGAVKGIALLGVIKYLEEIDVISQISRFIGSSVGSCVCFLLNIGYKSHELIETFVNISLDKFKEFNPDNIINFLEVWGFDEGNRIEKTLRVFLKKKYGKDKITLLELYNLTKKELNIMTTCINLQTGHLFNHKTFPDVDAITAIRASISVPVLYIPIKINGNTYVDGALISNYPIEYAENNNKKTIGIILSDQSMPAFEQIISIDGYLRNTLYSVLNSIDRGKIKKYYDITIALSLDIGPLDFNIDKEQKIKVIESAYNQARRQMRKKYTYLFPGLYNPMIKHISH